MKLFGITIMELLRVINFFGRKHDLIIFYVKDENTFFKNKIREPHEKTSGWIKYKNNDPAKYGKPNPEGKRIHDVWRIPSINNMSKERTGYPTQKPLTLLERIIKASSNEGDVVLDPFCGCATTCIASEKLNRQWIGIDISVKAYDLVRERLRKEVANPEDLTQYLVEVDFQTSPPKRTDTNGDDGQLKKYVYVISHKIYNSENKYKVGIASNVKSRLNSYQTGDPERAFKLEHEKLTPWFREIESYIHDKFKYSHEWVKGKLEDIIEEIENFDINEYNQTRDDLL